MKNIDLLKNVLCDRINSMSAEELYSHVLQPKPLIKGLCKYCIPLWGECPDTIECESICISRFVKWCEMENYKMDSKC